MSVIQPAKGGRRPGAGRPKGRHSAKTLEIAKRAAKEGTSPLEIMLMDMRFHENRVLAERRKGKDADMGLIERSLQAARDAAKDAAPYMHSRLQAIEAHITGNITHEGALKDLADG